MADGRAAGRAGEAAVRDERAVLVQLHARQRGGRVEHLAHAGAAFRALVADDDHIALVDLAGIDGLDRVVLGVEYARRAFVHHHLRCDRRTLDHAAVLRDIAPQHGDAAGLGVRVLERTHDLGVLVDYALEVLADRLAGRGDERQVEQVALGQFLHDGRDAARHVQLLDVVRACGREVADVRHLGGQLVEHGEIERHARLVRQREQVQHRVGRAADRHFAGQRVAERGRGQDVARLDVARDQLHDLHARVLGQMDARRVYGRDRAVAGQRHADRLGQAVHGVCGVHTRARAAARARAALALHQLFVVDQAGLVRADRLKGLGERDLLAVVVAGEHRAARDDDGRDVEARRGHQHAGHDLVAVRNEHEAVELVRLRQRLDAVRDQLAAGQRVLHADVAHRDAVAHADGRHHDRGAARDAHARLGGVRDLVEVDMARDDLTVCGDNADDRLFHLLFGQTAGAQQRTVGHALCARGDVIASLGHGDSSFLRNRRAETRPPVRLLIVCTCCQTAPQAHFNRKTMLALFFVKSQDMRLTFYTRAEKSFACRNFSQPRTCPRPARHVPSFETVRFKRSFFTFSASSSCCAASCRSPRAGCSPRARGLPGSGHGRRPCSPGSTRKQRCRPGSRAGSSSSPCGSPR